MKSKIMKKKILNQVNMGTSTWMQVGIAKEMRALLLTKLLPKMLEAVPFDDEIKVPSQAFGF